MTHQRCRDDWKHDSDRLGRLMDLEDFREVGGGGGLSPLKRILRLALESAGLFYLEVYLGSCFGLLVSLFILATRIIRDQY